MSSMARPVNMVSHPDAPSDGKVPDDIGRLIRSDKLERTLMDCGGSCSLPPIPPRAFY
jgi:hypothetical protein